MTARIAARREKLRQMKRHRVDPEKMVRNLMDRTNHNNNNKSSKVISHKTNNNNSNNNSNNNNNNNNNTMGEHSKWS